VKTIYITAGNIAERISLNVDSDSFPDLLSPLTNSRKRTFQRARLNTTPNGCTSLKERPAKFAMATSKRNCMGKYRKDIADTNPNSRDLNKTLERRFGSVSVVKIK
jgi:hypothetical protein